MIASRFECGHHRRAEVGDIVDKAVVLVACVEHGEAFAPGVIGERNQYFVAAFGDIDGNEDGILRQGRIEGHIGAPLTIGALINDPKPYPILDASSGARADSWWSARPTVGASLAHASRYATDPATNLMTSVTSVAISASGISGPSHTRRKQWQGRAIHSDRAQRMGLRPGLPNSDAREAELPIWLHRYNWHRPHSGIKYKTPISRLALAEDNLLRLHSQTADGTTRRQGRADYGKTTG